MWHWLPPWLTIGVVLIAIVPLFGGIMVVCAELVVKKERKNARLKRTLIVIGGLLSIVGAFLGAISASRDAYELMAFTTGGDGYCYLYYAVETPNALRFMILNDSDYPLYDVGVSVLDQNKWLRFLSVFAQLKEIRPEDDAKSTEEFNQDSFQLPIGNLRPNDQRFVWDAPITKEPLQRYVADLFSRNSYIEEEILLGQRGDGTFTAAYRVWKQTSQVKDGWHLSEIVKEEVTDDFRKLYPSGIPWNLDLTKPQQGVGHVVRN